MILCSRFPTGFLAQYTVLMPRRLSHERTAFTVNYELLYMAVRKLGLTVNGTKRRFHDLRHVFGTWLLKEGVSLDVLRELLGHRDRDTTDRYATLNRAEAGKFLRLMPRIKKPRSEYDRKNWHKLVQIW